MAEKDKYGGGFEHFSGTVKKALDMASAAKRRSLHLSGIATLFKALDVKMGGLQLSDLIILAGFHGMGKTSFATNIANTYKLGITRQEKEGGFVGFFSLEMSYEQLTHGLFLNKQKFLLLISDAVRL